MWKIVRGLKKSWQSVAAVVGVWVMREKKRPKLRSMQDGWKGDGWMEGGGIWDGRGGRSREKSL